MKLPEIREKYPQYNNMSDDELLPKLYSKYESKMDYDTFLGKVGGAPEVDDMAARQAQALDKRQLEAQAGKGFYDAVSSTLGLPIDAIETVMNIGIYGYNQATGSEVPQFKGSLGSSENMQSLVDVPEPQNTSEQIARVAGVLPVAAYAGAKTVSSQVPAAASTLGKLWQGTKVGGLTGAGEAGVFSEADTPEGKLIDMGMGGLIGSAVGFVASGIGAAYVGIKNKAKNLEEWLDADDARAAKYKRTEDGSVVANQPAREALSQGLEDRTVQMINGSSDVDKEKMLKMVETLKKARNNRRYSVLNRPSDVIGDTVMERFDVVRTANRRAGQAIDEASDRLRGKTVDHAPVVDEFLNQLDAAGVQVSRNADGSITPNFSGSDFEGLAGAENIIKRIIFRMSDTKPPDAHDVHRLKRYIDNNVSYGKTKDGLTGDAERLVKGLRHDLDGLLDGAFPAYDQANTAYSETIRVIKDLESAVGTKIDLSSANANKALGTLARRLMSNAQSRVNVLDTFEDLQNVAINQGGEFTDDLINQVAFVDDLEALFGPSATTSLRGEVGKAAVDATLGQRSTTGAALDVAKSGIDRVRGITPDSQIDSIMSLLTN
tara:strand:+ start:6496 stop:8307 length:1812 start_codon:yes stop_codon:yes gene_type:complete